MGCLVFVSSSKVVSGKRGLDFADENVPFVTSQEDRRAHAIAVAEAEVLKARRGIVLLSFCPIRCASNYCVLVNARKGRASVRILLLIAKYGTGQRFARVVEDRCRVVLGCTPCAGYGTCTVAAVWYVGLFFLFRGGFLFALQILCKTQTGCKVRVNASVPHR